ncbi:MAG: hypothetical protein COC19_06885 [SAR86 cluster bacterium]|uniref:FMN-binding domain-containing protein n=1 Tax=SAR86 cluster bacterium TaxID=2030880 RepID=A0A2A4MI78_9GAMM|nr:MAG: hypothetical protein COC19_06885 [SAR86 cluster bacterium]
MTRNLNTTLAVLVACVLAGFNALTQQAGQGAKLDYDRVNLQELFQSESYDNDVIFDTFYLSATQDDPRFRDQHLLGLRRDRLAYIAKAGSEVVAIAVPATADDGFNGTVDLLVAVNMVGRITAARVLKDQVGDELYGVVEIIESQWMLSFSGNSLKDIQRLSWQTITAKNEYDQFVGASLTPRSVADRIYDSVVFIQSNRIALMAGDP